MPYQSTSITQTYGAITGQPLFKASGVLEDGTVIEAEQLYPNEDVAKQVLLSLEQLHNEKFNPPPKPKISQPKSKK